MHPTSRFGSKTAALGAVLLLVGTAGAQEARPAAPAAVPQVHKMTIYNGSVPTVSYSVQGGSPHLQALCQTLQFTENELNLTRELQKLRLGIVANEQTLDTLRTWQQLGLGPISTPGYAACCAPADSALKRALIPGLAREATAATAFELINIQEKLQTEIQAEQKKAPAPGAPPQAGAVAAPQAVAQQLSTPVVLPAALRSATAGTNLSMASPVQVSWGNSWWPAEIKEQKNGLYHIHYTGWADSWDEWVPWARIRVGNGNA